MMLPVVRGNGLRALPVALMIGLPGSVCVVLRLSLPLSWERLLFFLTLAVPFAGVGSLVWSVGHPRPAARLFSLHCLTVIIFLVILPSSAPAMVCLGMLARVGAGVLLLRFLRALAADSRAQFAQQAPGHARLWRWSRLLVEGLGGCCALLALLSLLFAALAVFLLAVLLWPIAALVRRHYRQPPLLSVPATRWCRWSRITALLYLLFAAGWVYVLKLADESFVNLGNGLDVTLRLIQLVGLLAVIGSIAAIMNARHAWREPGRWWRKANGTLLVLACAAMLWFTFNLHLLNLHLNY